MRVLVTTWYDDAFTPIGDLARASFARYCRDQGYELLLPRVFRAERPAPWHKIEVLRAVLDEDPDLAIWIDADAMIVRPECPAHTELPPDRDLGLVKHQIDGKEVVNTGVMLLRNTRPVRELLDEIWHREEYLEHPWWENAAAMDVLGYREAFGGGRSDEPDPRWESRIRWLGEEWNSLPEICEAEEPIITHYAGRPREYRLERMRADAERTAQRATPRAKLRSWVQDLRRALIGT